MRRRLLIFIISISVIALLVLIASTQLEIYPRTKYLPPSREAEENVYFALDKWLEQTGRPVRVRNWGNIYTITESGEKTAFVQASLFVWYEEDWTELLEWVEAGGVLIISLDDHWYEEDTDAGYSEFLAMLGIWRDRSDPYENVPGITDEELKPQPYFDREAAFIVDEFGILEAGRENAAGGADGAEADGRAARGIQVMTGNDEKIRLVNAAWAQGRITVIGKPLFMRSWNLELPENVNLTWNLFKNDLFAPEKTERTGTMPVETNENAGVLFIRGDKPAESLFGKLFERGDFTYLIISGLILIAIGLWMVLPRFGFPLPENETPLKPIRERFLAEAGFLKKYHALDMYRSSYIQEIKRRLFRREGFIQDEDIPPRIVKVCGDRPGTAGAGNSAVLDIERVKEALTMNKRYRGKEFAGDIITLKTILERL
ncbi:MAG: DUF4350 domain-containing protein [Treponema sp.]|jgi:hypothetical protein|nr:DUF4350 domain-containing protein [Treponema sp.]